VPVTLVFKDAKGVESKMELKLPVNAPGNMGKGQGMGMGKGAGMPGMAASAAKP
jgi:hypothetical protein